MTVSVQVVQPVGPPGIVVGMQVLPNEQVPVMVTSLVLVPLADPVSLADPVGLGWVVG